jgi:hypothetical protein
VSTFAHRCSRTHAVMALSWHSRSLFASVGIGGAAHGGADTRRHPRGLAFRLPVSGAVMPDRAPSLPRASHRARTLAATAWRRWSATAVRDCCTTRCRSRARTAARTKSESSDAALSRKAIVLISLGVRYPSAPEFAEVPSLRSLRSTPPLATIRSRRPSSAARRGSNRVADTTRQGLVHIRLRPGPDFACPQLG